MIAIIIGAIVILIVVFLMSRKTSVTMTSTITAPPPSKYRSPGQETSQMREKGADPVNTNTKTPDEHNKCQRTDDIVKKLQEEQQKTKHIISNLQETVQEYAGLIRNLKNK